MKQKHTKPSRPRCLACGTTRRVRDLITKKNGKLETFPLCTHHIGPIANMLRNTGHADAIYLPAREPRARAKQSPPSSPPTQ